MEICEQSLASPWLKGGAILKGADKYVCRKPLINKRRMGLTFLYVCCGALFVCLDLVDNKPTTASTGLVTAYREASLNWTSWFSEGIWWTGKQTPTPLPFTLHGLFFSLFGYSVRGILLLHTLAGALSTWL